MNARDHALNMLDTLHTLAATSDPGKLAEAARVYALIAIADELARLTDITQSHHFAAGGL